MLSCVRYGDINYFAACFLTVTGRRGSAYAYSSRVYDDISTSACASVRGVTTLPISTPPDVVKVPISLPIIIVSEDPCKKFIDIYAAPNALLPSRTDIGDYVFTSPRTGFGVVAPTKRRAPALASTTSFFNNAPASASPRRLRHAPVLDYHRGRRARPLPFPSRSQPTPASTPCHPRIWTTTTILRRILLTTRIDVATTPTVFSSPFRTTPSAFRTTRASATFIVVRMPF